MAEKFTDEQRKTLRSRGLEDAQIERLEALLPTLSAPPARPRMQDVRDPLDELAAVAQRLQKRYARLDASREPSSDEARTRIQFAQELLGYTDWNTLERCIETVARITATACAGMSEDTRRSTYRNPIGQILAALAPAAFDVTRKKQPFLSIAQVVSEASGAWNVDNAIRAFLKPDRGE